MQKRKIYEDIKFSAEVIREANEALVSFVPKKEQEFSIIGRKIQLGMETWGYDTDEEFFSDFRKDHDSSYFLKQGVGFQFEIISHPRSTTVTIAAPERRQIEAVFQVFEENVDKCRIPPPPEQPKSKPYIFIGHGGSHQWNELKDLLRDKMGHEVLAYEIGARAGHTVRDILEEMLGKASFAILVMTGEDIGEDGKMRARQNVIHELGLFQGRLGFTKAVALLEEGTEEFSNLHGINQIRYGKGNIKETFGEVLATLRREFGD